MEEVLLVEFSILFIQEYEIGQIKTFQTHTNHCLNHRLALAWGKVVKELWFISELEFIINDVGVFFSPKAYHGAEFLRLTGEEEGIRVTKLKKILRVTSRESSSCRPRSKTNQPHVRKAFYIIISFRDGYTQYSDPILFKSSKISWCDDGEESICKRG
jgi:hypothetical protein